MDQFDPDREEVIKRAQNAGVARILDVGSNFEGSIKAVNIAVQYEFIHAAVGIHPHEAATAENWQIANLKALSKKPEVVAIGETGLDYFKNFSPKEKQRDLFRKHIQIAREVNKPIIIHCREAWDDLFFIMDKERAKEVGGIIHCFSGNKSIASKCMELGFYISFGGPLTYPKSDGLRETAAAIPSHRLFTETDCPYLAPQSKRGKRNEPAFVIETAKKLAEIKGVATEDLGRVMEYNLRTLFGIGESHSTGTIVYKIRNSLYLNITGRCTNDCQFCDRKENPIVAGHNLKLKSEPTVDEFILNIGNPTLYNEIVFCGYGEPTLRLDVIKRVAKWVKEQGGKVRLNTNGQANLIHKRNILPELKGLVDAVSVSLNAENEEKYSRICNSEFGKGTYQAVKEFIREAVKIIPEVTATVVRLPDNVDVEQCENIAKNELGAKFRIREFNVVG